jgi:hypothetical protein
MTATSSHRDHFMSPPRYDHSIGIAQVRYRHQSSATPEA